MSCEVHVAETSPGRRELGGLRGHEKKYQPKAHTKVAVLTAMKGYARKNIVHHTFVRVDIVF